MRLSAVGRGCCGLALLSCGLLAACSTTTTPTTAATASPGSNSPSPAPPTTTAAAAPVSTTTPTASPSSASASAAATTKTPPSPPPAKRTTAAAVDPIQYELGSKATTRLPVPACNEVVAFWTAALGPVEVTVNADGPTSVEVVVNGTTVQDANIAPGNDTHIFAFPSLDPASVKVVKVTATDSPQETGGSCIATGSPTN